MGNFGQSKSTAIGPKPFGFDASVATVGSFAASLQFPQILGLDFEETAVKQFRYAASIDATASTRGDQEPAHLGLATPPAARQLRKRSGITSSFGDGEYIVVFPQ